MYLRWGGTFPRSPAVINVTHGDKGAIPHHDPSEATFQLTWVRIHLHSFFSPFSAVFFILRVELGGLKYFDLTPPPPIICSVWCLCSSTRTCEIIKSEEFHLDFYTLVLNLCEDSICCRVFNLFLLLLFCFYGLLLCF